MDFVTVVIFLGLYMIRPQDWIGMLAGFQIIRPLMLFAIYGAINRKDGFDVKQLLRTPHDWALVVYFVYVVMTAESPVDQGRGVVNMWVFYFLTMLALSDFERLRKYLQWWMTFLVVIAAMAYSTTLGLGIDFANTVGMTAAMKGRLVLDTWMHNNPNALGHSVIVALPLIYFLMIWKRPGMSKAVGLGLILLCGQTVLLTESKGAFLAGFVVFVGSQVFGRPRVIQISLLIVALTIGVAGLSQLPRMQSLTRQDEGIQGRLIAWQMAQTAMEQNLYGVGWSKFMAEFKYEREWVKKATHSSYVQIGASLGKPGLWIYCLILYSILRTVFTARARDEEEERVRRCLFVLVSSFMISNWMIDRAYHTEFWLTAAVAGAYHRLLFFRRAESADSEVLSIEPEEVLQANHRDWVETRLATQAAGGYLSPEMRDEAVLRTAEGEEIRQVPPGGSLEVLPRDVADLHRGIKWRRFGVVDFALTTALFLLVIKTWDYVVVNF